MSEIGEYSEGNMSAAGVANVFHGSEIDGYELNTDKISKDKEDNNSMRDAFHDAVEGIV